MNRLLTRSAEVALVAGSLIGIGSYVTDITTCPGEVESKVVGSDAKIPVVYCDENPNEDGGFDRPGTPEQKVMYGAAAAAITGGAIVLLAKRPESVEPSA